MPCGCGAGLCVGGGGVVGIMQMVARRVVMEICEKGSELKGKA